MDFRLGNMHECRNLSLYIVKRVHLYAALVLTKFCPFEHRQTEVDGCGVKGIDMTIKLEDFLYPAFAGLRNHVESELLEDAVIALLVSL